VSANPQATPIFILCGGLGTRLKEETEFRPKPMVPVGGRPILWHVMKTYSAHGFKRFVLCLGFRGDVIKEYFLDYSALSADFTVALATNEVTVHSAGHDDDWVVTLAETGDGAMTGARVARAAERYLDGAEHFGVTYGDGLTDADLAAELAFHTGHGAIGTILGVSPPSRFGQLRLEDDRVVEFSEKPEFHDTWINGGFLFFRRDFLRYLSTDDSCVLEREPLVRLAADSELRVFRHDGFWAAMDTQRDREELDAIWAGGDAPWRR
jgi:glucose-1-phosphate cytidylyltransferase